MKNFLINDNFIAFLILFNAIILFADSFTYINTNFPFLIYFDLVISVLFLVEMFIKIHKDSWRGYISNHWNKFDFSINLIIVPSFVLFFISDSNFLFLTIFRLIRVAKFFRFFKFVPNIEHLISGISRAMKASVFVIVAFFIYLFIVSIFSCSFFREVCPEHFGDPITALYSTFKIFTVEGWYELPELIAQEYGPIRAFFVKIYFIFLVLTGGVFGMSLVNAIFVDEMVSDNNDEVLRKIEELNQKFDDLQKK